MPRWTDKSGACGATRPRDARPARRRPRRRCSHEAKDYIAKATAPVTAWDGPTTGPKAQGKKLIVYVSADQRNGGAQGVGDGAQEAAKALGWDFRILDGQGSVPGRTSALTQAIALKPDGIILGNVDTQEQAPVIEQAGARASRSSAGTSGPPPGPVEGIRRCSPTSPPTRVEVAKAAASTRSSIRTARPTSSCSRTRSTRSPPPRPMREKAAVEGCQGCKVLEVEDTPIGELSNRMGQLTTSLLSKYGKTWTYSIAVNDLYFDFSAPSLQAAGVDPATGYPRQISAGDGSVPAFQRIRDKQYQIATVAEPLHLHGWKCIDEMNRAFAGQPPSGYVRRRICSSQRNIEKDGGANNIYDPGNGYKDKYKKIWGRWLLRLCASPADYKKPKLSEHEHLTP